MDTWICTICGYVYDPAEGDPDNGVPAGTAWEDVPDDWLERELESMMESESR